MAESVPPIERKGLVNMKRDFSFRPAVGLAVCAALALPFLNLAAVSTFLPKDTRVELRLKQSLSSASSRVNDRVEFEVTDDVKLGDLVPIPAGSLAWGIVVEAVPRSRLMRAGKLSVDIQGVCLATGEKIVLRGTPTSREGLAPRESDDGPSTNVLALPALPVLLFVYGKDVSIPEGRTVAAYTSDRTALDPARFANPLPNITCDRDPIPTITAASDALATFLIRSTPSDAELSVDGRYFGNTPSTVRLTPGDHLITASAPGRKTWERTVHATPKSEVNITAVLEERPPIGSGLGPVPTPPKQPQP